MNRYLMLPVVVLATLLSSCAPILFGGAVSGGVVATSNRTTGAFIEDEGIEIKSLRILVQEIGDQARYSVVSINRVVLVVGQAPDDDLRNKIINIVSDQENVRRVIDEIVIGPEISFRRQATDALITTKIKAKLLQIQEESFSSLDIKVLTEDGVVYLLGLVSKNNAAKAVDTARRTSGVKRVVKAFEYQQS